MALTITTLTPAAAQQNLQNDGLDTLGLTTVRLSPAWANLSPLPTDYDGDDLTLNINGDIRAPFLGIREYTYSPAKSTLAMNVSAAGTSLTLTAGSGDSFPSPQGGAAVLLELASSSGSKREIVACSARAGDVLTVVRGHEGSAAQSFDAGENVTLQIPAGARTTQFLGADGASLSGSCIALRLHPQAVMRLEQLIIGRFQPAGGRPIRPVPWAMVVRGAEGFTTPRWCRAGDVMTNQGEPQITGRISFHGRRGQIIDPIYVAALFSDLLAAFPGLLPSGATVGALTAPGGINNIDDLASGTLLHFVDLHGGNYRKSFMLADMVTINNSNTITATVPETGLLALNPGDRISAAASGVGRLRWGWATNGVMGRAPLTPPALPPTGTPPPALSREFLRVAVVDATWSLLGNRVDTTILDVGGDDDRIPTELLPEIRDQVDIDYIVDGPDMLAEVTRIIKRLDQGMVLAVSPDIDGSMETPSAAGDAAHWPQFPAPNPNTVLSSRPSLDGAVSATFTAGNDVVVTIAAGTLPDGVHVRIYPQQFVEIAAIAEEPSFLRADGGAALVIGGMDLKVMLANPFALQSGQTPPNPANLTMDIVITPRQGRRELYAAVSVTVAAGPEASPPDPFVPQAAPQLLGLMVPQTQGIAESPLFGIARTIPEPPQPPPGDFLALIVSLAAESSPRQAPRLPTMARFDTFMVTGTKVPGPAQPPKPLLWDAVLSGGRLTRESRSALHGRGNPGNPPGPDVHAPGVRVTGALAYDVAFAALHRAQPIIPLPGTDGGNPGWIFASLGDNFNEPDDSANISKTGIGILLQTVAVASETPWLATLDPPPANLTVEDMVKNAADAMGLPAPGIIIQNEARIQRDIRREFFVSKHGLRDAQWSLRRALNEARELVYIESPQFSRTARPSGAPEVYEVDLVTELAQRLKDAPELLVLICTPREPDFSTRFKGWWRQHYADRSEALAILKQAAPNRVALFHPVGFPGRTAFIRTTSVIVDDVWCLVGATHFRRRGMTFDGSSAIASFDRELRDGYSRKVRDYRRALMAAKLKVTPPADNAPLSGDWIRLGRPASAFDVVADLLAQGGLGRIQPLYPGPSDNTILPVGHDVADPDGSTSDNFLTIFAGLLNEAGD